MSEINISDLHLLLIDDNARFLESLERRLKKFGYCHIHKVTTSNDAQKMLEEQSFDVIVADMRMEKDDSGFEIIDITKELQLSSIVIVLTANDTVADCRKALKGKGAWDYISKGDSGDHTAELRDSIQQALDYFSQWGNIRDKTWIIRNTGYFIDEYYGKYVAVLNNRVIASADTESELKQRIIEEKLPLFLPAIEKIGPELFNELTDKLLVFVEGPTDVKYIRKAMEILECEDIRESVILDTIGNRVGNQGGGATNLAHGFNFLKEKPLMKNKILFLADQDVSKNNMPNKGKDFENLYVRRIDQYSVENKGIEWLFPETVFEEGIDKGYVAKTIVSHIPDSENDKTTYNIRDKNGFCDWICKERENTIEDFEKFKKIFEIFEEIQKKS